MIAKRTYDSGPARGKDAFLDVQPSDRLPEGQSEECSGWRRRLCRAAAIAAALSGLLLAQPVLAQDSSGTEDGAAKVRIELNKLEPQENGACRVYFVVDNETQTAFSEIGLDIFLFRKDGVIDRRAAMNISAIAPQKTRVVLFDLPDTDCGAIGRFLLNDVLTCQDSSGAEIDCAGKIALATRTDVEFDG